MPYPFHIGDTVRRDYEPDRRYHQAHGVIQAEDCIMAGVRWVEIIKNEKHPETVGEHRPWAVSYMRLIAESPTWEV